MNRLTLPVVITLLAFSAAAIADSFVTLENNVIKVTPFPVAAAVSNQPWPAAWEEAFRVRGDNCLRRLGATTNYGNTFFENEKQAYPKAMASWILGVATGNSTYQSSGKSFLQGNAIYDTGSGLTDQVDFFPSFTLNGQMPKFFWFGQFAGYLDAAYTAKMITGADKWTDDNWVGTTGIPHPDPLGRPHPNYDGTDSGGWGPDEKNSWVDVRTTDNLKAMREAGAYLFAGASGNTGVQATYRARIINGLRTISRTGVSEWDSPNYYPWAFGPWLALHTFAADAPMQRTGKGLTDYWIAFGALKYWRGGFAAPGKRSNTGSFVVLAAPPAHVYNLYFGDCPLPDTDPDVNTLHPLLSAYRPPHAVAGVARKEFGPVEVLGTKPSYGNWTSDIAQPEAWETLYQGHTFQLASIVAGGAIGDAAPFSLMARNEARGVDFLALWSGSANPDSLYNPPNGMRSGDQMAQFRNLFVMLRAADGSPFQMRVPKSCTLERTGGVWFYRFADDKTWAAVRPVGLTYDSATDGTGTFVNESTHRATGATTGGFIGLAMEVGERPGYSDYAAFKRMILTRGALDVSELATGTVTLTSPGGHFLKMQRNTANGRPLVWRNSTAVHNWLAPENFDLYKPVQVPPTCTLDEATHGSIIQPGTPITLRATASAEQSEPLALGWKTSVMEVKARGWHFTETVDAAGGVTWSEVPWTPANRLAKVEFYVDGALVGEDAEAPFEWTQSFAQGTRLVRAKAIGTDGSAGWSQENELIVDAEAPGITTPPADATKFESESATFTVVAQGPTALTYRWLRGTTVIPNEEGASLTLSNLTLADSGTYTVEVTNTNGTTLRASALLTVLPAGPTISNIVDQTLTLNSSSSPIAFTISDPNGDVNTATLAVLSSNPALLPPASVSFAGMGGSRTLTLTPAAGQTGTTTVTITITDVESRNASDSFVLSVVQNTLTRAITASSDDAEEPQSAAAPNLTSTDLELVNDGTAANQTVGLRFLNVTVPPGATIITSSIQFKADEANTEATALTIRAQAADNAATFAASAANISARPRTAATVSWAPPAWNTVGEVAAAQRTPDLSALVQEVVSRSGWASGNALSFIITGTGHRTADAFDESGGTPAQLTLTYTTTPPDPFAQWLTSYALTGADAQPLADPDRDGLSNLAEFAFKTNPTSSADLHLPAASLITIADESFAVITYRQRTGGVGVTGVNYRADGVTCTVEVSSGLTINSWQSGADAVEAVGAPTDNGDATHTVSVRSKTPLSLEVPREFLRVRLTR